jgi:hypothetical protein
VADGPQSVIADQVRNGVAIRMALIHRALQPEPGKSGAKVAPRVRPAKPPTARKAPAARKAPPVRKAPAAREGTRS